MKYRIMEHKDYLGQTWYTIEQKTFWWWSDISPIGESFTSEAKAQQYLDWLQQGGYHGNKVVKEITV